MLTVLQAFPRTVHVYIDGSVQYSSIPGALAMEILQFRTKPSTLFNYLQSIHQNMSQYIEQIHWELIM